MNITKTLNKRWTWLQKIFIIILSVAVYFLLDLQWSEINKYMRSLTSTFTSAWKTILNLKYVHVIHTVIIGDPNVSKVGADILWTYKLELNAINFIENISYRTWYSSYNTNWNRSWNYWLHYIRRKHRLLLLYVYIWLKTHRWRLINYWLQNKRQSFSTNIKSIFIYRWFQDIWWNCTNYFWWIWQYLYIWKTKFIQ